MKARVMIYFCSLINNNDVAKVIYEDMDAMNQYTDMISRYKNLKVGVIFTNYENVNVSYDAPEPIRNIKQERHLLYFDDLDNLKSLMLHTRT